MHQVTQDDTPWHERKKRGKFDLAGARVSQPRQLHKAHRQDEYATTHKNTIVRGLAFQSAGHTSTHLLCELLSNIVPICFLAVPLNVWWPWYDSAAKLFGKGVAVDLILPSTIFLDVLILPEVLNFC